jgi:lipopolysaccharide/colanic/teichoic acid biosynthesis glycosyltransferase
MRQISFLNRKLSIPWKQYEDQESGSAFHEAGTLPWTAASQDFTGIGVSTIAPSRKSVEFGRISKETALILHEAGMQAYQFIRRFTNPAAKGCVITSAVQSPVQALSSDDPEQIICLKRVNDLQRINKFFESVNRSLKNGGIFIGKVESYAKKKTKIMAAYPPGINVAIYAAYYLFNRVFPKLPYTKQLYYITTRGNNRVLSKAETYGRLYSCGFEIMDESFINGYHYFACRKVKEPMYDTHPTFGMFIRLKRIGQGGTPFNVYKLRTMHAYSEYLQQYVFKQGNLDEGGKFKDDFRVTTVGKSIRKYWIDELPMLINVFIKRNIKIVGVRPLSEHYFSLYSDALKEKRVLYKPGLIPPYYAQYPTPKSLDEIQKNEMEYLDAYEKSPLFTDLRYFFMALGNIFFRKARSK